MSNRLRIAIVLLTAFVFGVFAAWAKGPGAVSAVSEVRNSFGNLSTPWLLVAFVAGSGFSRLRTAALAGLVATTREVERAATLFGASDAVRASIGAKRQPDHQILYDRWLARTLAQLDTNTYSNHYEDGRALTLDEACALALGEQAALIP